MSSVTRTDNFLMCVVIISKLYWQDLERQRGRGRERYVKRGDERRRQQEKRKIMLVTHIPTTMGRSKHHFLFYFPQHKNLHPFCSMLVLKGKPLDWLFKNLEALKTVVISSLLSKSKKQSSNNNCGNTNGIRRKKKGLKQNRNTVHLLYLWTWETCMHLSKHIWLFLPLPCCCERASHSLSSNTNPVPAALSLAV